MDISKETNDAGFTELKLLVSNWYDKHISINMLKVLYRDHVKNTYALHESSKTMELIDMLISSGNLSPNDLTLLYDTIKATEQFGLEQQIHTQMPSFKISKSIRDSVITKFTPHRQRLVKLGMALTKSDVRKISELYDVKHTDSWSLIMDLEHDMVICEENMTAFIEKLKKLKFHQAVKALTEDIPKPPSNSGQASDIPNTSSNSGNRFGEGIAVKVIHKRKRGSSESDAQPYRKYALDLLNELDEHKNCLDFDDIPEFYEKFEDLIIYYKRYGLTLTRVGKGSIVFYLIANDPNALMNLWEMHSSKNLIKDLAGILVPEKHQQKFLDEWMTYIDENEYKAALSKLKGKVETRPPDLQPEFHLQVEKAPISKVSELSAVPEVEECAPYFTKELETKLIAVDGESTEILQCAVAGIPRPQVTWYFDNIEITDVTAYTVKHTEEGICELHIQECIQEDEGYYTCKAVNHLGEVTCTAQLLVKEEAKSETPDVPSPATFEETSTKVSSDEQKTQVVGTSKTRIFEDLNVDAHLFEDLNVDAHLFEDLNVDAHPSEDLDVDEITPLTRPCHHPWSLAHPSEDPDFGLSAFEGILEELSGDSDREHEMQLVTPQMRKQKKQRTSEGILQELQGDSDSKLETQLVQPKMGDLRGYVARMLRRKGCYVKDEGMFKEKEHEKECFTQSHSSGPSFIKSSQDMDDSEPSVAQELPSKSTMKYESHIEDICKSLRMFSKVMKVISESDEQIIQLMSGRLYWINIEDSITELKKQSSEDIGKMFAHILIAIQDEDNVLMKIHELCTNDIVSSLSAECKKLNFKYNITGHFYTGISKSINVSFLIHLLCSAPRLRLLNLTYCHIKGVNVNEIADTLYQEEVVLELTELDINGNNLSDIKGSSLATLLAVAPKLNYLSMSNCSISGAVMDDMVKECSSRGVEFELTWLDISRNNLNDIKRSSLATLLAVAPKLSVLHMSDCNISGAVMDEMVKESSSRGVKLYI